MLGTEEPLGLWEAAQYSVELSLLCVEGAWKGRVIPRHQALRQTIRGDPAPHIALTL